MIASKIVDSRIDWDVTGVPSILNPKPPPGYTEKRMIHKNRLIPVEQLKLLIFDLDGTLVDSRIDLANSVNAMLRHFGKAELPDEVIASYIGDGAPMLVRRALGDPDD